MSINERKVYNLDDKVNFLRAPTRWGKLFRYVKNFADIDNNFCLITRSRKECYAQLKYCSKFDKGTSLEYFGRRYMCNNKKAKKISKLIYSIEPNFPYREICKLVGCDNLRNNANVDVEEVLTYAKQNLNSSQYLENQLSEGVIKSFSVHNDLCPKRVSDSLVKKVDHVATVYPFMFNEPIRQHKWVDFDKYNDLIIDEVDTVPSFLFGNSIVELPIYFNKQRLLPRLNTELSAVTSIFKNNEFVTSCYERAVEIARLLTDLSNEHPPLSGFESVLSLRKERSNAFNELFEILERTLNTDWIKRITKNTKNLRSLLEEIEGLVAHRIFYAAEMFQKSGYKDVIRLRMFAGKNSRRTIFIVPNYKRVKSDMGHILNFNSSVEKINDRGTNMLFMGATFDINHIDNLLQTDFGHNHVYRYDLSHFLKLTDVKRYSNIHNVSSSKLSAYLHELVKLMKILLRLNKKFFIVVGRMKEYEALKQFKINGVNIGNQGSNIMLLNKKLDPSVIQGQIDSASSGMGFIDYMLSPFQRGNEWFNVDYAFFTSLPVKNLSYSRWYYKELNNIVRSSDPSYDISIRNKVMTKAMNDCVQYMMRFVGKDNMTTSLVVFDRRFFKHINLLPTWARVLKKGVDTYNLFKKSLIEENLKKILPKRKITEQVLMGIVREFNEIDKISLKLYLKKSDFNIKYIDEKLEKINSESDLLEFKNGILKFRDLI